MEILNLIRRVRRVLSWVPFLWSDNDFDWAYVLRLWAEKLRRVRHHISGHRNHEGWEKDCASLDACAAALIRLSEDDYARTEWLKHRETFPWQWDKDGYGRLKHKPSEEEKMSMERVFKADEDARVADEDLFWLTFRRNYRDWWD